MVDHTDTQVFDSHSQASSPSRGENENAYKQIQDTVPFDDTMVLDSPLVETKLEKQDFETQVVDDSDCFEDTMLQSVCWYEKEVVLDSEDEGFCRTKALEADKVLSDDNASIDEPRGVECGVTVERTDQEKNQEPGESSQANALEFVDRFLSLNKMDLSPECGIKKIVKEISLSVSSGKGLQSLAKRMKNRKTPITKIGIFDWPDSNLHGNDDVFSKGMKAPSEFGTARQESLNGDQKALHINSEGGRNSGSEHEKNKRVVNLPKEIACSTYLDSRILEHNPKQNGRIEQESLMNIKDRSVKKLNEHLHAESSDQKLDGCETGKETLDIFDVGLNTQIAAEAMEALSYAPITGSTVINTIIDSPKGVIMNEAMSEQTFMKTSLGLGGVAAKSKRRKRNIRKSGKNSNKKPDPELPGLTNVKSQFLIGEQFDIMKYASNNGNSGNGSPRLIVREQADGSVGRNNKKCENHMTSSILVEQEESLKDIAAAEDIGLSLAGDTLRRTNEQSDNPRDRTKDGIITYRRKRSRLVGNIITYRRKRSRLVGNPTKAVGSKGIWSALHSNSLAEAKNNILSQKEETCQDVTAMTSCLNLLTWSHPKGKRTVRSHSNGAINIYGDLGKMIGKEGNCMKSQRKAKDNGNTSCCKDMKGKPHSVHSSSPRHLLEKDLKNYFDEPGSPIVMNNASAIISKGTSSEEVDNFIFPMFSNVAEKNHKFRVLAVKNLEPSCSGYVSTVNFTKCMHVASSNPVPSKYHRKAFNKTLSKSSLRKELIRLDVPESMPDFTWKDLRRRRDMAHIRVLFSQHLNDDVIKQQKKISARLGISIATSPWDATHFIADRFVRTRNMLETIALGKPVVTHLWLDSCGQASCLIDEKNYILRDAKKEKEIGFSMPVTYTHARQQPLLKGQRVFITPSIKPSREMISSLVKAVQGQVVEISQISAVKEQKFEDNPLILSSEEDHAICEPFLDKGMAAYGSELLLNGIVIQRFEFERHKLFGDHAKMYQPQTKSRRDGISSKRSLESTAARD